MDSEPEVDLGALSGEEMSRLLDSIPGARERIEQGLEDVRQGHSFPLAALTLSFRPLALSDLERMLVWLNAPHVKRWWHEEATRESVLKKYLPRIWGLEPVQVYVVSDSERPIGFLQSYLIRDHPDYAREVGVQEPGIMGIDYAIGEEALLGQGLGAAMIERFVVEMAFSDPQVRAVTADPAVENQASIRALEKAGFRAVREFESEEGRFLLMRRDR